MKISKVLVVDDDADVASMLAESLTMAQFDVVTASSLSTATEVLEKHDFDIVLVDLRLPDGNGLDLARMIRTQSAIPIVMMSGKADDIDRILGLEMVADDYIQKPFLQRELIARLRAILRRYDAGSSNAQTADADSLASSLSFHRFTLDLSTRELITDNDDRIELTTREFDVLSVMVKNRGKVMSRQEIYIAAGMGKGQADRQVDGLISRLRTKLYSEDEAARKIRTVHGRGYVLADH